MSNVRRAVVNALIKQEDNAYSNLVLNAALTTFNGTQKERAQISALFYGVIERQITLDFLLAQCLSRPLNKLDKSVRAILRSGLYQMLYMQSVPSALAVNESVILTRKMGKSSAAGMVNAVLRKAGNMPLNFDENYKFDSEIQKLSVQYSVSMPIVQILKDSLGTNTQKVLENSFVKPKLCIRVNTLVNTVQQLKENFEAKNINVTDGELENSLYVDYKGDITKNKLFEKGAFHIQSEASQFACYALSAKPGEKVLDLCAAPGGKSVTLAQYMQNDGELYSCDYAKNRLSLIDAAFSRTGVKCASVLNADASVYMKELENADKVLCDVPCSGLGIMAKKPDIRYKDLSDINELIQIQSAILQNAAKYVKKGGKLVYSTCTINKSENEDVVENFLNNNKEFKACKIGSVLKSATIYNEFATFLPLNDKTDGFFVALLQKV